MGDQDLWVISFYVSHERAITIHSKKCNLLMEDDPLPCWITSPEIPLRIYSCLENVCPIKHGIFLGVSPHFRGKAQSYVPTSSICEPFLHLSAFMKGFQIILTFLNFDMSSPSMIPSVKLTVCY